MLEENSFQEILEQLVSMPRLLLTYKVSFVPNRFSAIIKNLNYNKNGVHILTLI